MVLEKFVAKLRKYKAALVGTAVVLALPLIPYAGFVRDYNSVEHRREQAITLVAETFPKIAEDGIIDQTEQERLSDICLDVQGFLAKPLYPGTEKDFPGMYRVALLSSEEFESLHYALYEAFCRQPFPVSEGGVHGVAYFNVRSIDANGNLGERIRADFKHYEAIVKDPNFKRAKNPGSYPSYAKLLVTQLPMDILRVMADD